MKDERLSFFDNLAMKIQFEFLESEIFQATGLDLNCLNVIFETLETFTFNGIENTQISSENYPLAYFLPDDKSIHIFIDHTYFNRIPHLKNEITDSEIKSLLMFLFFHETHHNLLLHTRRSKERDQHLWNIACDLEIHNLLFTYNQLLKSYSEKSAFSSFIDHFVFSDKRTALFENTYLENTAEEIYADLQKSEKVSENSFSIDKNGSKITVTEVSYKLPSGRSVSSSYVSSDDKKIIEDNSGSNDNALIKNVLMKNTLQNKMNERLKSPGNFNNPCSIFLKKLFNVKIDWKKILASSLINALEKTEIGSWSSPRTSLFALDYLPYLPGFVYDEENRGTVFIVRDESGSITNEECQQAASIVFEAKEFYKKIILLKHDTKITSVNEFEEIDDDVINKFLVRESFGGTSHKEVFEYIHNYIKKNDNEVSCCIFITDLESDIIEFQHLLPSDVPKIYLTTNNSIFKNKYLQDHLDGKIILIEK